MNDFNYRANDSELHCGATGGFMNAACRVFPECFNAFGHQKHITAQKHNTLLHGSASFTSRRRRRRRRPSPQQTSRKCQPHPHELKSGIFQIHNDTPANPHPLRLILLWLSKKCSAQ